MAGISQWRSLQIRAIIQLAIFILLHLSLNLSAITQPMSGKERSGVCRGDHALCGCAPARISAGTCCCAISSLPPCCQKEVNKNRVIIGPVVTVLPCGSDDPVLAAIIDVYLPNDKQWMVIKSGNRLFLTFCPNQTSDHYLLPAIPPPQSIKLS